MGMLKLFRFQINKKIQVSKPLHSHLFIEREFVKPSELKLGDLFCEATDCLQFVFEGFDKLDDPMKTYAVPDLVVWKFKSLYGTQLHCTQVFPAIPEGSNFTINLQADWRFRRVKMTE
jgi:hypothetical protein